MHTPPAPAAGLDTAPYGVDPVFKSGTTLYNPDLDSAEAVHVYYNCSALPAPTYNVTREGTAGSACWVGGAGLRRKQSSQLQQAQLKRQSSLCFCASIAEESSTGLAAPHVSNAPPYCAELFSPRSLPYGFHAATLRQFGDGFPVLFVINLDAAAALNWLAFIQVCSEVSCCGGLLCCLP